MVKTYTCEKCGKVFNQKGHYTKHLNRKTPCKPIENKIIEEKVQEKILELSAKGDIEIKNTNLISNNQNINIDNIDNMEKNPNDMNIEELEEYIEKKFNNKKIKVLDLFCGCGGFTKGLEDAGLNVIAGIDHWNPAVESYKKNFDHICLEKDLTTYTPEKFSEETGIKDIDLLVGGPPCQGFSMAGKRDKKDPRNSLFMEYVKYLQYFKPKMFIMENVRGILSMKTADGTYVKELILNELTKEYNCIPFSLYARDFEVPQIRNRVLFIGIRKDLGKIPSEPKKINPDDHIPVSTILLPENQVTTGYLSEKAITGIHNKIAKMKEKGYGFGAQFLKMDKPSYTIPARYHKDGYDALVKYSDKKIRKLTVTELKRIQTFGDDFILQGDYKEQVMQIGNAVASRFSYHIGKYVINTLQ
jgi:DNA (cytosine-5)-methyltransferase 1